MDARELEILALKNRIELLRERTTRDNGAIVNKLLRRLRRLEAEG